MFKFNCLACGEDLVSDYRFEYCDNTDECSDETTELVA